MSTHSHCTVQCYMKVRWLTQSAANLNPLLYLISTYKQPVTSLCLLYTTAINTVRTVTAGWSFVLALGYDGNPFHTPATLPAEPIQKKFMWASVPICKLRTREEPFCLNWRIKNQLDATYYFIVLPIGSTCFGHYYAHHQELATIMLITKLVVSVSACCVLEVRCG